MRTTGAANTESTRGRAHQRERASAATLRPRLGGGWDGRRKEGPSRRAHLLELTRAALEGGTQRDGACPLAEGAGRVPLGAREHLPLPLLQEAAVAPPREHAAQPTLERRQLQPCRRGKKAESA